MFSCDVHEIKTRIRKAESFLVLHQKISGFWNDYCLEPGLSLSRTTAYVGFCLSISPMSRKYISAIKSAATALHRIVSELGWGYNQNTSVDADSTSWALRFLARLDYFESLDPVSMLKRYICPNGAVKTFLDESKFGRWSQPHEDVTPVLGLALIETGASSEIIQSVRCAVLDTWYRKEEWSAFWWKDNVYAWAQNLNFLKVSVGIIPCIKKRSYLWVEEWDSDVNAFNISCLIYTIAILEMTSSDAFHKYFYRLLMPQNKDGSWPSSKVLLVPQQYNNHDQSLAFSDQNQGLRILKMSRNEVG